MVGLLRAHKKECAVWESAIELKIQQKVWPFSLKNFIPFDYLMKSPMKPPEKLQKHNDIDDKLREQEQKFRGITPTGDEFLDAKVTSLNVDDLRAELLRLRNEIVALQEKRTECEEKLIMNFEDNSF